MNSMSHIAIVTLPTLYNLKEMLDFRHLEGIPFAIELKVFPRFHIVDGSLYQVTMNGIFTGKDIKRALSLPAKIIQM